VLLYGAMLRPACVVLLVLAGLVVGGADVRSLQVKPAPSHPHKGQHPPHPKSGPTNSKGKGKEQGGKGKGNGSGKGKWQTKDLTCQSDVLLSASEQSSESRAISDIVTPSDSQQVPIGVEVQSGFAELGVNDIRIVGVNEGFLFTELRLDCGSNPTPLGEVIDASVTFRFGVPLGDGSYDATEDAICNVQVQCGSIEPPTEAPAPTEAPTPTCRDVSLSTRQGNKFSRDIAQFVGSTPDRVVTRVDIPAKFESFGSNDIKITALQEDSPSRRFTAVELECGDDASPLDRSETIAITFEFARPTGDGGYVDPVSATCDVRIDCMSRDEPPPPRPPPPRRMG